jgi:predicted dehydrogenase
MKSVEERSFHVHHTPVRWGVMGSAWINEAAVPGIVRAENARLQAIASRTLPKAEKDADRWGASQAYGSYEELLADPEVDAVYIPLPNMLHMEWTIKALLSGKHVLCEKPLTLSVAEAEQISTVAAETGLFVSEAFMYRFAPRWERALELIRSGVIGESRVARMVMGFKQNHSGYNIRFDPAAGGGVLWDMGCYVVNKARLIFGREPIVVQAMAWKRPGEQVDTSTNFMLDFGDGRSAICAVSFDYVNPFSQDEVIGTAGWLNMPGTGIQNEPYTRLQWYQWQNELFIDGAEPVTEIFSFSDNFQLEFEHMSRAINTGTPPKYGIGDALANVRTLEALFESLRTGRRVGLPTRSPAATTASAGT